MSNSSWKERFARRASGKARDLVQSGSPAILCHRTNPDAGEVNSIAAIESLMQRHVPLQKAKRAIEAVLTESSHDLRVAKVADPEKLCSELQSAGLLVRMASVTGRAIDVTVLRESLGTSREQFAARYRISPDCGKTGDNAETAAPEQQC